MYKLSVREELDQKAVEAQPLHDWTNFFDRLLNGAVAISKNGA